MKFANSTLGDLKQFPFADWSTCQLSERAVCGSGIKTRMLDCVRSDGKSVDLKFCEEVRYAMPFNMPCERWTLYEIKSISCVSA